VSNTRRGDDRWCAITVFDEAQWDALVRVLGSPPWAADARFATLDSRRRHAAALDAAITESTATREADALMEALQNAGVPAGIVADAIDLCVRNPQLAARGYWTTVATPEGEQVTLDGVPFRLSSTPGYVAAPAPLLGEHAGRVCEQVLGMTAEEIARLRAAAVIG
jgi:benzylsuccinate CoA-transferase BbsF subunit